MNDQQRSVLFLLLYFFNEFFIFKPKGEYESLWAAATGGRGTGRGRKKKINTIPNPENLLFGMILYVFIYKFVHGLSLPILLLFN